MQPYDEDAEMARNIEKARGANLPPICNLVKNPKSETF
jgi:hypothetical protein